MNNTNNKDNKEIEDNNGSVEISENKDDGINNTEEKGKEVNVTSDKSGNVATYVGIAVVIIVIGAVVYYLYLKKNKK